ncbi:MAG TPA: spermidine/putrescine ABC transporter substrate-binding protein [Candidatus Limnocylindrales bacterium]|nr:spermidine/putrescine ABC transporter substrate-binding protein [Candidatus Limnocylindrales bacterium]
MDEALRQYQEAIAKAQISRRRFMTGAALAAGSAALAACTPTGSASSAPASQASAASATPGASVASAAPTAVPSYKIESDLFLYNWSDYFDPDNKKAFTAQFGLKNFKEDTFQSNEEMLAKLQAGGKGQYDISVPTAEFSATLAKGGFLQKLDKGRLPNLKNVNQRFLTLPFDPNDDYIVPKDWGTTGIIYRGSVKEPVTSWKDFWTLATGKYSGKTLVVNSPGDVFVAPLRMHGYDVNTTSKDELDVARQELLKLRPHLQSIDSDNYPDTLRSGDAVLALAWNGTAYLMQLEDKYKDTGYTVPSDGTIQWVDTWVLLAEGPNPNAAYAFLNWIQDPNVQVKESAYAGYASCNDAAKALMDPAFVNNPAVYVPEDQLALLSVATDQSGNQQRADIWAEFLAAS